MSESKTTDELKTTSESKIISATPQETWQILQNDPKAVLIDIRSEMEYLFIGHPKGAIHIPWIDEPDWKINPRFAADVRKIMLGGVVYHPDDSDVDSVPVLLICRSGRRSLEAGKVLVEDDFNKVYNVVEGFEGPLDADHHRSTLGGWRYHGLPWEQC
ncbi:rhodanese-like domain-containing protein [Candidatus Parabeggiatoa sp. HSG14]|uniref:rhodanese-like domain-containing protein n=1 Tax=Candidatus Parabeggiatoa sp. HSG14 TaxID=3055593 RepID=UPI0025A74CCD|nr:rhodanese-like domain-containing protein [Thiotrichales bacterium HSG14]